MKQLVSHCLDQQQNKLYYCIKDWPDTRGSLYGLLNCENGGLDCHVITIVCKPRVYYIHMYHLFCNALVHVIYSGVSGQCSHTIRPMWHAYTSNMRILKDHFTVVWDWMISPKGCVILCYFKRLKSWSCVIKLNCYYFVFANISQCIFKLDFCHSQYE